MAQIGELDIDLRLMTQKFERGVNTVNSKMDKMASGFQKITRVVGGVTAALGVGGLATSFFQSGAQLAATTAELKAASDAFGISTQAIQQWTAAAKPLGITAEQIPDIFKDITEKIGDFAATGGGEAKDVFEKLALDVEKFKNLAPDEALLKIGQALDKSGLTQGEKVFLLESLANDASKLLPLLENNAEAFNKVKQASSSTGALLSDNDVATLTAANDTVNAITASWRGLTTQASLASAAMITAIGPDILSGIESFKASIDAIATEWAFFKDNLQFSDDAFYVALRGVGDALAYIGDVIQPVIPYLGELAGIGGVMAASVAGITAVTAAFGLLGSAIAGVGSLLLANPITAIIAGIGAAAYLIYDNWEGISAFFSGLWTDVAAAFSSGMAAIQSGLASASEVIGSIWGGMWNAVKNVTSTALNFLKEQFPLTFTALSAAAKAGMQAITGDFSGAWETIKAGVRSFGEQAVSILSEFISRFQQVGRDIIQGLVNGVRAGADAVVNTVRQVGSDAWSAFKSFWQSNSPSKLTEGLGKDIMAGQAIGIQKGQVLVDEALLGVADSVSRAFEDDLIKTFRTGEANFQGFVDTLLDEVTRLLIVQPLMDSIFGAVNGNGQRSGGLFGEIAGSLFSGLPGFATGGSFTVGGAGGTDSKVVAFRATPGERVTVATPQQQGMASLLNVKLNVINNGEQVSARTESRRGAGGFEIDVILDQIDAHQAKGIRNGSSQTDAALRQTYNMQRSGY